MTWGGGNRLDHLKVRSFRFTDSGNINIEIRERESMEGEFVDISSVLRHVCISFSFYIAYHIILYVVYCIPT